MDETKALEEIKKRILSRHSLDVSQYKENYIKRRIAVRMRALSVQTYGEYLAVLDSRKEEYDILLDKLTINVTQFFRDPEAYIVFENEMLPEIMNEPGQVRIWSAGCSTGDEPYSIAISVLEAAEKLGIKGIDYEIHATDIDEGALRKAVDGRYEEKTLENIAESRKQRYFRFISGKYQISDEIKKHVKFGKHNLMDPYRNEYFDVVFCRNVIIYFNKDLQRIVLAHFHAALKPGRFFVMGKTETMLLDFRDRFQCVNIKERMFRKI